jgi:HEAT repeat protein
MGILKKLFGPPDIEGLKKTGNIRGLSRALRNKNTAVRLRAVRALSSLANQEVLGALVLALNDGEADIRLLACQSLGRLGDKRALSDLIGLLHDKSTEVEIAACEALAKLGSREAVKPILEINTTYVCEETLKAATSALQELGRLYPADLVNAIDDDNYETRSLANRALAALEDLPVEALIASFKRKRRGWPDAASLLAKRPDARTVQAMLRAITNDDAELRAEAAHVLGYMGDARAVEPLIGALRDPTPDVRAYAALSLAALSDPRAVEPLVTALEDENAVVFEAVGSALGKLRDPRAVEPLMRALEREIAGTETSRTELLLQRPGARLLVTIPRHSIVSALGELGDGRAVQPLLALLAPRPGKEVPGRYLVAVVTALERLGEPSTVMPLISLLEEKEQEASRAEQEGTAYWAKYRGWDQSHRSSYGGYKLIHAVIHALVSVRGPLGLRAVIQRLGSTLCYYSGTDRDDTATVFPVRDAAQSEIREMGEAAVEPLLSALRDERGEGTRSAALEMLAKIGSAKASRPLTDLLRTSLDLPFRVEIVGVLLGWNDLAAKVATDPDVVDAVKAFLNELTTALGADQVSDQEKQALVKAAGTAKYWLGIRTPHR